MERGLTQQRQPAAWAPPPPPLPLPGADNLHTFGAEQESEVLSSSRPGTGARPRRDLRPPSRAGEETSAASPLSPHRRISRSPWCRGWARNRPEQGDFWSRT